MGRDRRRTIIGSLVLLHRHAENGGSAFLGTGIGLMLGGLGVAAFGWRSRRKS